MCFSEHKFAVKSDEKGHTDRNQNEKTERQAKMEKYSDYTFFHRINLMKKLSIFFLKLLK